MQPDNAFLVDYFVGCLEDLANGHELECGLYFPEDDELEDTLEVLLRGSFWDVHQLWQLGGER